MLDFEDWDLEDELKQADRLLAKVRRGSGGSEIRLDEPHSVAPAGQHTAHYSQQGAGERGSAQAQAKRKSSRKAGSSAFITWPVILAGVTAFVCGAVLTGWSHFANRPDLWHLGLPLTLSGQAVLIAGLILQLESVWQSARKTSQTVDELDNQLEDLRHQTTLLSSTGSEPSQAFYAHMAGGAPPGMLLADVKSQLDLVAQQLARQRNQL